MSFITTMTQKGQITIPKMIRGALHVSKSSRFLVRLDAQAGEVRLKPISDFSVLAGSLASDISLSDDELQQARKQFEKEWPRRSHS